jgi:hypothetical protein
MSERGIQHRRIGVCAGHIEEWDKDAGKADPERTVRAESQSAKGVPGCKFPHSSAELSKTTVCKS